jgi:hypothetical protein
MFLQATDLTNMFSVLVSQEMFSIITDFLSSTNPIWNVFCRLRTSQVRSSIKVSVRGDTYVVHKQLIRLAKVNTRYGNFFRSFFSPPADVLGEGGGWTVYIG